MVGLASRGEGGAILRHKLDAIGFGFLIPIFFVMSRIKFNVEALLASPSALLRLPVFLLCFLVVRGVPVCLYRREVEKADLLPLALYAATALPLVVAITRRHLANANDTQEFVALTSGAMQVKTPNTRKSAWLVVRSDWIPACR
jgi:Kef-type K+ transport system membrane component KefB